MIRFRDGEGDISTYTPAEVDDMQEDITDLFRKWCKLGMAPHDFKDWLSHAFYSSYMDYVVCKDMGGMGGCKTVGEWINKK